MDDKAAKEELRLRLIEAEVALKEAEEEYDLYVKQLDDYRNVIKKQKEKILAIKARLNMHLH